MGLFNFGKANNNTYDIEEGRNEPTAQEQLKEGEKEGKVEYIWVDGYKGMLENMTCKGFQYEIGKSYSIKEDPIICKNGFHFCLNLSDVFSYYGYNFKNRYFIVKCLVSKSDYEKYGEVPIFDNRFNQLVAKEIKIIREVSQIELFPAVKKEYSMIESIDEFVSITDYKSFVLSKFTNKLKPFYSEAFGVILFDKIYNEYLADQTVKNIGLLSSTSHCGYKVDYDCLAVKLNKTIKKAIALTEEGLSKDMCACLLLCK